MSDLQNPVPQIQKIQNGNEHRLRGSRSGALVTTPVGRGYLESVRNGNVWTISTPVAGITVTANMLFSVASSNAIVGLYNKTSDKYLHITRTIVQTATATVCNIVWAVIPPSQLAVVPTGTTARSNRDLTAGGHAAIAFNGAQACSGMAATQFYRMIGNLPTAAGRVIYTEDDGEIVVPPYGFAGVYGDTTTAGTVVWASLTWEEHDV